MITKDKRNKILIVEDDATIGNLLGTILRLSGYDALYAPDRNAAIDLAKRYKAEVILVICDVVLKSESGRGLIPGVRAHCPGARVLFISGLPINMLYERSLLQPADLSDGESFYLQKPFLPDKLTSVVERIVERAAPLSASAAAATIEVSATGSGAAEGAEYAFTY